MTDQDGRFTMRGLRTGARAWVFITSPVWLEASPFGPLGAIRGDGVAWLRQVDVEEDSTVLDVEVASASVQLHVEVVQPVWPLPTHEPCVGVWFDDDPEAEPRAPDIRINTSWLDSEPESRRSRTRYCVVLDDLPAGRAATAGLGVYVGVSRPTSRMVPTYSLFKSVSPREGPQAVKLVLVAPYARLSRVLAYGVPSLVVLAVCVPILVRHVRRRCRRI